MSHGESTRVVLVSLAANAGIALAKTAAAGVVHSGAMLAEALHSWADCANQVLLLVGARHAARPPSTRHPLGYGRAAYLWSFLVALMLFFGGGVVAIAEGVYKFMHPEPVEHPALGFAVLALGLALDGMSLYAGARELRRRAPREPFLHALRESKDADVVVVVGENLADVIGLAIAAGALALTLVTQDGRWDAAGSIAIGAVLLGVAGFLGRETQSLLVGEAADPSIVADVRAAVAEDHRFVDLLRAIAIQQGPGEIMLAMKVRPRGGLTGEELVAAINALEVRVRKRRPEVRWLFTEPDDDD